MAKTTNITTATPLSAWGAEIEPGDAVREVGTHATMSVVAVDGRRGVLCTEYDDPFSESTWYDCGELEHVNVNSDEDTARGWDEYANSDNHATDWVRRERVARIDWDERYELPESIELDVIDEETGLGYVFTVRYVPAEETAAIASAPAAKTAAASATPSCDGWIIADPLDEVRSGLMNFATD